MKTCGGCGPVEKLWKAKTKDREGYCASCWPKYQLKEGKQPRKINKVAARRKIQVKSYSVIAPIYKANNPECKAKLSGCTGKTTEIHHKMGRIEDLLCDIRFFLPVCRSCHDWIEVNSEKAKELGFSVSRLANG